MSTNLFSGSGMSSSPQQIPSHTASMDNNIVPDPIPNPSSPTPPQQPTASSSTHYINGITSQFWFASDVEQSTNSEASSSVVNGNDDPGTEYYFDKLFRNKDIPNSDDQLYQFDRFPVGYRFQPKDHELILDYLMRKVLKLPMHRSKIVDINIYDYNPFDLIEIYKLCGEKEWYFFTPRDRKYPNGSRPNRKAGDGYWKATGADKTIKDNHGRNIGLRKALVFYQGKPPSGQKTNWIMHEYRVSNPPPSTRPSPNNMRLDDWVLCRIYHNISKNMRGQNRDSDEDDNSSDHRQLEEVQTNEDQIVETVVNNDSPRTYHPNNNTNTYFNPGPLNHQLTMDIHDQLAPPPPYNCYQIMNNNGINNFNGHQHQQVLPFAYTQPVEMLAPMPAMPVAVRPPPPLAAPPQEIEVTDHIFTSDFYMENPDLFSSLEFYYDDWNFPTNGSSSDFN